MTDKNRHTDHISEGEKNRAGLHLNEALKALYANLGPSPVMVHVRAAMAELGIEETVQGVLPATGPYSIDGPNMVVRKMKLDPGEAIPDFVGPVQGRDFMVTELEDGSRLVMW